MFLKKYISLFSIYEMYFKSIVFLAMIFLYTNCLPQVPSDTSVVAVVGNQKIKASEVKNRLEDYLLLSGVKDNILVRKSILNNMTNEILLYYYDDNRNIFANPEYQKELNWAKRQTILAFLEDRDVYAKITVTDQEVRQAFYRANEYIAVKHLYAKTESEAESLYQLLQAGVDFDSLAAQVFTDSTLRKNGGYLGYFTWGDMDPNFEEAAYNLKIGEISKPVKTAYGYSIIKLIDAKPHPLLTETEFLNKKDHFIRVLKIRKKGPAEREFINKIFDQKKLRINEKVLNALFESLSQSPQNLIEKFSNSNPNLTCVQYGNKKYSITEIQERINQIPFFHRKKIDSINALKTVIKGLVIQDLLYQRAVKEGYDKNPEVEEMIRKYNKNIFLKYKREEIAEKSVLPDSVIHKFYTDNLQYFRTEPQLNIQEIILKDKKLADSISTLIRDGADFGPLAKQYSIRKWSAENNGVMGFAEISKFGILKDTLWKYDVGSVLGPVNIEGYYGIFKILGKKEGTVKPFEEVRKEVVRLAKKEKSKQLVEDYVNKIKERVVTEEYDKNLSEIKLSF
ncbi:peptidylprolyl isomerase [Melioribacteraceae bacterium 4301-Me]|uniref:peptidylprolyl isomerase n=1 Tax=Pyranulibacter aquaticus TaxID=3163344 RepID=UPI00359AACCE